MTTRWFVARTKPNGETRALENLSRQGFRVFLPLEKRQEKRGRRQVLVLRPLFPGYIFLALDLDQPGWAAVNNTFGVLRLISLRDGRPSPLPAGVVEELLERTDDDGRLLPPEDIPVGSRMRLVQGPFANWVAEVVAAPEDARISLLLDLMGRKVTVTTSRSNLARSTFVDRDD
ncbi:transcriptional activator RfaH [Rhodobacterales bacterium HKCCSP123]|nr:transcriptional activator RfaH [Rhodobacterales bacterium HKCCSP123]